MASIFDVFNVSLGTITEDEWSQGVTKDVVLKEVTELTLKGGKRESAVNMHVRPFLKFFMNYRF